MAKPIKSKQVVSQPANTEVAVAEKPAEQTVAAPKVRQANAQKYKLGAKNPGPRTSGADGQNSNTQTAWNAIAACLNANGGTATYDQLVEALKNVGLQFKTYVPYFTNRCHWLAYAE